MFLFDANMNTFLRGVASHISVGAEMKGSYTCMPNVTRDQIKFYAVEIVEFFFFRGKKKAGNTSVLHANGANKQ